MGVHALIDLKRAFSRSDVVSAVDATVRDFPVLGCRYEPGFFRDRWVPAKEPVEQMVVREEDASIEAAITRWAKVPFDPTKDRPLRVVLLPKEQGSRLLVSLSHIAVDGAGMAAVGHVLGSHLYGRAPLWPVEKRRDIARAMDGLAWYHLPGLVSGTVYNMSQVAKVLVSARRERPYPTEADGSPRTRTLVFSADEVRAILARSGGGLSINDVLVAAVARIVARRSDSGPVPVLYTMDLRRFSRSPHLSATNASTILSACLPREATRDLASCARATARVTARHKKSLIGPAFVLFPVALFGRSPHAFLRRMLPGMHTVAVDPSLERSIIFTNVGKLDRGLGPLAEDIESLRIVGPNIQGVKTPAIVAFGLHGRLHLQLFAPPGLAEDALGELEQDIRFALELPV